MATKKILKKIIKNGVEYYLPEGGGGGGGGSDLDVNAVNGLIDAKLGHFDDFFKVENGLYKLINGIDDSDELGLTSGDTWADIVGNQTSMSKISHCYAVMTYIVNSVYAMETIVGNDLATKEISECWNSMNVISKDETASGIYLGSSYGIKYLFTYGAAQDAFFTSAEVKQQIVSDNIMVIVNDNTLLNSLQNDSVVVGCIISSQEALRTIAGDSDKLEIVKNNTTIMNTIAANSSALNSISDSDFFEYILENETYLNTCSSNTAGQNKINSFNADDLLEPIYFWTGDLGYNSWTTLSEDGEAINSILSNANASKIALNNNDCKQYFPYLGGTFNYTGSDQAPSLSLIGTYKIECWGAGSRSAYGGYASGTFTFSEPTDVSVMVGANGGNGNGVKYGFGGSANGGSNASGGGLSGVFSGTGTIGVNDSARAIIIAGGAGGSSAGTGGAGGGETGGTGSGSYGTAGAGGTQTGHGSGGNVGAGQFRGGNGSGTYGYGGGGGRRGGNSSIGDSSGDDDKGGGGGSGYVSTNYSMTSKVLTQGGGLGSGQNGKVIITRL